MLYDTEFLICLSGQKGESKMNRAKTFLARHGQDVHYLSRVGWAEYAEGCEQEERVDRDTRSFRVLEINERVAWIASRLSRQLKGAGQPIGDNDVWIAATAVAFGLPLVSNNARHFGRVPGLKLLAF